MRCASSLGERGALTFTLRDISPAFFFSSRRRHTRCGRDWSSDVCSSDLARYSFLAERLLNAIRRIDGFPQLDAGFETSVRGLHFLGAPAAWSFGPLMRFVAGASYASRALALRIAGGAADRPSPETARVLESTTAGR